jgi:hypothetical protein
MSSHAQRIFRGARHKPYKEIRHFLREFATGSGYGEIDFDPKNLMPHDPSLETDENNDASEKNTVKYVLSDGGDGEFTDASGQKIVNLDFNPVEARTDISLLPDKTADAFWFARNCADEYWPFIRSICQWLYISGYSLFIYVVCQGFSYVMRFVW